MTVYQRRVWNPRRVSQRERCVRFSLPPICYLGSVVLRRFSGYGRTSYIIIGDGWHLFSLFGLRDKITCIGFKKPEHSRPKETSRSVYGGGSTGSAGRPARSAVDEWIHLNLKPRTLLDARLQYTQQIAALHFDAGRNMGSKTNYLLLGAVVLLLFA